MTIQFRDHWNDPLVPDEIDNTNEIVYAVIETDHGIETWVTLRSDDPFCAVCESYECSHVESAIDAIESIDV